MGLLENTPLRKQKEKLQTGNSFTNHISDKKISIVCTQNILRTLLAHQHRKTTQLHTGQRIFNTSLKKICRDYEKVHKKLPTLLVIWTPQVKPHKTPHAQEHGYAENTGNSSHQGAYSEMETLIP